MTYDLAVEAALVDKHARMRGVPALAYTSAPARLDLELLARLDHLDNTSGHIDAGMRVARAYRDDPHARRSIDMLGAKEALRVYRAAWVKLGGTTS